MNIFYSRVSTNEQTFTRQEIDSSKYDKVFLDKVSGKIPFADRTNASKILELVKSGELTSLTIKSVDRLGRNTSDIISTLELLKNNNINVKVQDIGMESMVNGEENKLFGLITNILSSVAELERQAIVERTQAGRRNSTKKQGRSKGSNETTKEFLNKPKTMSILKLLEKGRTTREVGKILGCSTWTINKAKKAQAEMMGGL